jgi:prepilin-type N-terminal cleavage/methylation domain-containing protein
VTSPTSRRIEGTTASRTAGPPVRRSAGFTIIELLIVITLIGLLAGFALPRIDYQKMRMDATLRGVGMALVAAQRSAVTRQHNVIVLIDANANSIRIHDDRNNDQVVDSDERTRGVPMGDAVVIGRGSASPHSIGAAAVTFTKDVGGTPALTFYRNGSASELGGFYLTSRRHANNGDHVTDTKLVVIERSTGRVEWFSYNGSTWVRGF